MNKENLTKVLCTSEDLKNFLVCEKREDALKFLNDRGVEAKDEELEAILMLVEKLANDKPMDMDDMDQVAGGNDKLRDISELVNTGFQIATIPYIAPITTAANAAKAAITMFEEIGDAIQSDIDPKLIKKGVQEFMEWKQEFDASRRKRN